MPSRDLLSREQSKAARALLSWSRVRLAARAHVSEPRILQFENGSRNLNRRHVAAIRQALEDAGIVFSAEGPLLPRSEGLNGDRQTGNRMWRRRQTKRTP
ncbi:helix-turn-helix transcriptional regulator [Mesorhizobium sp.]|uniref:helix-turn-helix domain-containing protein n=1 Tax=Mesorhizobium sp. TaxID=1871066 RepID=UPI000FE62F3C|nr:MAG: XRE family transcriptional regulator [Mesorhizobium sp.]RWH34356.1 MAG: XRE family transcriptional regulator [Mesorhizobium sp.]TIM69412.1 MAG: helix-turn-helix transcriptional regulator [Mesorhizobium sp.]TIQ99721.1 MAG: helix-turn-helix transcriptional regulator [Mesorhizobium sp.]TIR57768.1 MAG: helix-turn-helix transcriptional regulator [Mesorhizobium sp.]